MDVTKENFINLLPQITETIRSCDFIAIDTELSGLMRERINNRFDLPEERFAKAVLSSRGYFIMQFGLSCFTRLDDSTYSNRTYNFYIFPQPHEELGDINRTFSLQAHAIQFLSQHNFDFNKLFKHGVSYLTFEEKKSLVSQLKSDPRTRTKVKLEDRTRVLRDAKGFLEIIEQIVLNKKPLVGHNLYLDLIQIINQFMEPLSEDYTSFKETCHSLFPLIYDTKYIAHSILDPETLTNNQSRLNDLYEQLIDSDSFPKIEIKHLGQTFDNGQLPHQAGYDAYMSGYCFIVLCEGYISETRRVKHNKKDMTEIQQPVSISKQRQVLDEFSNKIHLSYSYDLKYFNLGGDDEEPERVHVFYIEHPNTWTLEDIFQAFKQFGGVTACRLNNMSALCALRNPDQAPLVLKQVKKLENSTSNYKIFSYETYLDYYKPKKKIESGDCKDVECSGI